MSNGSILILTFSIPLILLCVFFTLNNRKKKRDSELFNSDLKNFYIAIENKHIQGVTKFGEKIVWNESLTLSELNNISKALKSIESPSLSGLKSKLFNKRLDWSKVEPPRV